MDIRKVHVIFKTHLDIGFTDFASSVLDHYLHRFFPQALKTAQEANQKGGDKLFVWTVGSYLIDLALRELPKDQAKELEEAVRKGDIAYHALPFTMHSELASPALFEAGLNIAARLDRRFGRKTIAAKMTDVPGHTQGIISPLVKHGVQYLHIGVNTVSRMPQVPPLFMWENAQGERLMVNYERSYGGLTTLQNHDEALYFLHTLDNTGPPSLESLHSVFAELRTRFPKAQVVGSTLQDFAVSLLPHQDSLPVLREEFGDTWIHGIGTDPYKTAKLRALDRLSRQFDEDGTWQQHQRPQADGRLPREAFLEELLLICEHTWGLDSKKFLSDFRNWNRADFDRARALDLISDADGDIPGFHQSFAYARKEFLHPKPQGIEWEDRGYRLFERSHQEQRDYLTRAVNLLPADLIEKGKQVLLDLPSVHLPAGGQPMQPGETTRINGFSVTFTGEGFRVVFPDGQALRLLPPLYQEVGRNTYHRFGEHYLVDFQKNSYWALPDNMKAGLRNSDAPLSDLEHRPLALTAVKEGDSLYLTGQYPEKPQALAGCPPRFTLRLAPFEKGLDIQLYLDKKPANRKPEALFVPFMGEEDDSLTIRKLGQWVSNQQVVKHGNRRSHGMDAFLFTKPDGRKLKVTSKDAVLLCVGAPRLLDFDGSGPESQVYVNLYNNLWGTNFKMWYEEPIFCRFLLTQGE